MWAALNKLNYLRDRGAMLARARSFFEDRGVLEVDVPALGRYPSTDLHIELFATQAGSGVVRYLHSSPEYGMKRLLSHGSGDCYQLSHVFRDDPLTPVHRPEFTMAEWYRLGFSLQEMVDETVAFASLFVEMEGIDQFTYQEALSRFAGVDSLDGDLVQSLENHGIGCDPHLPRDDLFHLVVGCIVEPKLPKNRWTVITHFPGIQAALARTTYRDGAEVAERFELYGGGFELANGYLELADPKEQERRLVLANEERKAIGKGELPVDQTLLEALRRGLPDCCGVAVGFDRLMLLRSGCSDFRELFFEEEI